MNVVDLVEAARPDIDPMPLNERRMVRERLFGAADDVVRTTIRERSQSGAVTSTAPPGYRARRVSARPRRPRRNGSFAKMGAGLLVVAAAGAAGWSWYADSSDEESATLVSESTVPTTSTTTTVAPTTTTLPPTRTGVTPTEPVVFPLGLIPIEEAVIDVAASDDQFVLMRAPDASWIRLEAVDGGVPDYGGLDFVSVGALDVAPFAFGEGAPWIYTLRSPCGAVRVVDAPEQDQFRPLVQELFEGMSIDDGGVVDALVPDGLRITEAADGADEYRTVFRFEAAGEDDDELTLVTLRQVPGGSVAQLLPGGAQPSEMVWLGEPALGIGDLDVTDGAIEPVSVFWRDADTVFSISSETVSLDELETFVSGLRAASTDDWAERFSASRIDSSATLLGAASDDEDDGEDDGEEATETVAPCSPQPTIGPTFRP